MFMCFFDQTVLVVPQAGRDVSLEFDQARSARTGQNDRSTFTRPVRCLMPVRTETVPLVNKNLNSTNTLHHRSGR